MPRIRITFRQAENARYIAHLDIMRAFERAFRRAGISLTYSQGYNPRPRISFAAPLPVGVQGCREYLDVEINDDSSAEDVLLNLQHKTPQGLSVVSAKRACGSPNLMKMLYRSRYVAILSGFKVEDNNNLSDKLECFLDQNEIIIQRSGPKKRKVKNIRPGIFCLQAQLQEDKLMISMELRAGSAGNVRPDEILQALTPSFALESDNIEIWRTALLSRSGQLLWDLKGEQ